MKSFFILLVAIAYYLDSTDACTCIQITPVEELFCQTEFTAVLKIGARHEDSQFKFYNDFTVEQVLRATDKGRKSLATKRIISSGPCGTFLEEGKEYAIIGSTDTDGNIHVGLCTYHTLWSMVKDDVRAGFLGGYKCNTN